MKTESSAFPERVATLGKGHERYNKSLKMFSPAAFSYVFNQTFLAQSASATKEFKNSRPTKEFKCVFGDYKEHKHDR
jgi:hypothetical protein